MVVAEKLILEAMRVNSKLQEEIKESCKMLGK